MTWQKMQPARPDLPANPKEAIAKIRDDFGVDWATAKQQYNRMMDNETWCNDLYECLATTKADFVHLTINRRDQEPVRDWRAMQHIKNDVIGPECEAVELYPAESRLVDGANTFHLWGFRDPAFRFPFGFEGPRSVANSPVAIAKQRPVGEVG